MAEYYNGAFGLEIKLESGYKSVMLVPSTRSVLSSNQQLPLNGRLSGNWIEANTRDQGFVLSISTLLPPSVSADLPPEDADQLLFLGWYTFGASGEMLWLTAAATVPQGSSEAEFEFVKVEAGQFLGNHNATRSKVGSGRIKARNCNSLEFEYDLTGLGLGTGGMKLQRIFALEIAGYHCRDYAARLASISAGGE
jgi:hypothetical protein